MSVPPSLARRGSLPSSRYKAQTGIFKGLISLLPLEDGQEIAKFTKRLDKFTEVMGPLAVGKAFDAEDRPLLWYAVDCDDPIACELLLQSGAGVSAHAANRNGECPYDLARKHKCERIIRMMKVEAHPEFRNVDDDDRAKTAEKITNRAAISEALKRSEAHARVQEEARRQAALPPGGCCDCRRCRGCLWRGGPADGGRSPCAMSCLAEAGHGAHEETKDGTQAGRSDLAEVLVAKPVAQPRMPPPPPPPRSTSD